MMSSLETGCQDEVEPTLSCCLFQSRGGFACCAWGTRVNQQRPHQVPDLEWLFGKPLQEQAHCGPVESKHKVVNPKQQEMGPESIRHLEGDPVMSFYKGGN